MKKNTRSERPDRTERMVAALAHEIRTPLNSMKGASQYLYDTYRETPEIREFTGIIIDEINRLESYLNEFLSFSRGTKLKLRLTDFESYLNGIIMIVKHSFPTDIRIVRKKDSFPAVMIDQEQLRQVLVNLFSNAKDALEGAATPVCEVILDSCKKHLIVTIKDNGCGIPARELKDIFVPFFTTKDTGLGIGLSISKSIIARHGGRISVKSKLGEGAAFTMEIPFGKGKRNGDR